MDIIGIRNMHNNRVKRRSFFSFKDLRYGLRIECIRAEAIHGLSRKRHEAAFLKNARGLVHFLGAGPKPRLGI